MIVDCKVQFQIFGSKKDQLMIATFNFRSCVSYESSNIHFSCFKKLIADCNIHFSFFLFSKKQLMTATFNFRSFVFYESIDDCNIHFSCFKELIADCNIHFSFLFVLEEVVDDCNVQFSIFRFLRINWWLQHSFFLFQRIDWWLQHLFFIFLFSKKQLMTATFNFRSFVSYELIDDCNIQFPSMKQGRYWRYIWISSLPVRNCED